MGFHLCIFVIVIFSSLQHKRVLKWDLCALDCFIPQLQKLLSATCPMASNSVLFVQVIHDFLFSLKESPEKFQIEANFPRRVLPCLPSEEWPNPPTLQEAGLSHTEVLFVQDLTDD